MSKSLSGSAGAAGAEAAEPPERWARGAGEETAGDHGVVQACGRAAGACCAAGGRKLGGDVRRLGTSVHGGASGAARGTTPRRGLGGAASAGPAETWAPTSGPGRRAAWGE